MDSQSGHNEKVQTKQCEGFVSVTFVGISRGVDIRVGLSNNTGISLSSNISNNNIVNSICISCIVPYFELL